MWGKYALISLLLMVVKFVLFVTILKSAWNLAFFDTLFLFFQQIFLNVISTFIKLWSQTRKKLLNKSKTYYVNVSWILVMQPCIPEPLFAITGSSIHTNLVILYLYICALR